MFAGFYTQLPREKNETNGKLTRKKELIIIKMEEEKLKTLKEIKLSSYNPMYNMGADDQTRFIRSKAVKWAKKLQNEDDCGKHKYFERINLIDFKKTNDYRNSLGISWEECSDIPAVIVFIKHFFNLTEEDLK